MNILEIEPILSCSCVWSRWCALGGPTTQIAKCID